MLPTPNLDHLSKATYQCVYEPAEDSFLFLDALEKDIVDIRRRNPAVVLEIGSGSGIITAFISKLLGSSVCYVCTDINHHAAAATVQTAEHNSVCANVVVADLVHCLLPRLRRQVDILLFNPPYVVTPSEDVGTRDIAASWSGGQRGREVIDRFLDVVPDVMSATSCIYLCVLKENQPDEISDIMKQKGFTAEVILSRRCGAEQLYIMKFSKGSLS